MAVRQILICDEANAVLFAGASQTMPPAALDEPKTIPSPPPTPAPSLLAADDDDNDDAPTLAYDVGRLALPR